MEDADEAVAELAQGGVVARSRGLGAGRSRRGRRVRSCRSADAGLQVQGVDEAVVVDEAGHGRSWSCRTGG